MPDPKTISSTSQDFLDIHDITDDIVILKNGSASVILTVNAMNFGLLAEQEQDAVIYSYASLLNSINYPIQILIQSQTKDASSYLELLKKREEKTTDKIKRAWIRRYSQFVSDLIKERNVLDKKFFVVIPASSLEMGLTPTQDIISGFKEQTIAGVEKSIILEKARNLLEPKKDHMIAQFNRIGLYAKQLTTQEIIRLFYTNYNPEATEGQQITNSQSYTTALVQAQIRGDFMNNPLQDQAAAGSFDPNQTMANQAAANQTNPMDQTSPVDQASPASQTEPAAVNTPPVVEATPAAAAPEVQEVQTSNTLTQPTQEINIIESPSIQPPINPVANPTTGPNSVDEVNIQENINNAINQLTEEPTL